MQKQFARKFIVTGLFATYMILSAILVAAPVPGNGQGLGVGSETGIGAPGAGGGGRTPGALPPGLAAKPALPPGVARQDTLPRGLTGNTPVGPAPTPAL